MRRYYQDKKSKSILVVFFLLFFGITASYSQPCVGSVSSTVNPPPIGGGYAPGTVVTYCYTVNSFSQAGTNWFEGFDINLGAGWLAGSITPVTPPGNFNGGGGQWVWIPGSFNNGGNSFGPGYFFDLNNNGITQDDFGDAGGGPWTMCFSVTVGNTTGAPLSVGIAPVSDGFAGSWGSSNCDGFVYTSLTPTNPVVLGCGTLIPSITNQINVLCNGQTNGSFTVTTTAGSGPFTFSYNGGPFNGTSSFGNLAAGAYSVVIMDAVGCTIPFGTTITQPVNPLTVTLIFKNNVGCAGGSSGNFKIVGTGGTGPFTYSMNGSPFGAASQFNGLVAGAYNATVMDANGCTANLVINIAEPIALTASITAQTNLPCSGAGLGSVTIAGADGTPNYTYSLNGAPIQLSGTFANLAAGNYTITVKDANNCSTTVPVVITAPTPPTGTVDVVTNVDCFGNATGALQLSGSNGAAPYTFGLNGGAFAPSPISNLLAGNYAIIVSDANGCTGQFNAIIAQPAAALSLTLVSQTNNVCFGGSTGIANITGNNGTAPYSYSDGTVTNTTGTFSNLIAGNHNYTVTDANGCTAPLLVVITQPLAGVGSTIVSQTNVLCTGTSTGSFTVAGNNGLAPYNYTLNGITNTSGLFSNLAAALYNVTVSDANGCTAIQNVNLISPSALSSSINSQVAVSCFGGNNGSLDVDAVNGTSPYTFTLNGSTNATGVFSTLIAGNYSVVVSDQNGCTVAQAVIIAQPAAALTSSVANQTNVSCFGGSNGAVVVTASNGTSPYTYLYNGVSNATGAFNGFANGNYSVLISDQNACTHQQNITITQPAAALNANTVSNTPVDCFGSNSGAITLQGLNGTAPYSYALGATNNVTGIFTNLLAGAHTIIVTDANNCAFNYNINISQPGAALTALIQSQVNVFCFGSNTGSITLAASNGTAPYTYGIVGSASSANNVITGLSEGTYNLIVEDNNGCTVTLNGIITQPASGLTGVINSVTDVLCFGNSTGAVNVTASNGTLPYLYAIAGNNNNTGIFNGLAAGNYNIQLTDANGCISFVLATVNQPATAISVTISLFTNVVCNGFNNGTATALAAGGVNPATYVYQWNTVPVQNTATASNLMAGTYSITVNDDNGCIATSSVTISEPNFVLDATADFTICNTQDSLLEATSLDGAAPVTYTWINLLSGLVATGSNFDAHPNITTNYSVQATDINGCLTAPHLFTINVNPLPVAAFSSDFKKGCEPLCPTFSAVSTLPNTIWEWNFGDGQSGSGQTIVNCYKQSGLFTPSLTAISDKGCKSTLELVDEIVVFASPKAIFTPTPEQTTLANPNITFINGTANAEKFTWKFGDNSPLYVGDQAEHAYDAVGNFCIVLYAENYFGCIDSVKNCVDIKPDFHFYVPLAFTPNGDEHNNIFRPVGEALIAYHLTIYNRRGLKIFQSNSIDIGWDGSNQPQDAYSYVIELTTSAGDEKIFSGNVTLLR